MIKRNKHYTVFSIKNDAIKRSLTKELIKELEVHSKIISTKNIYLNKNLVNSLKKWDWEHNWTPYPSNNIKHLSYANETGSTIFLLCKTNDNIDAVAFGDKIKGSSHNPFISNKESLRSRYADKTLENRVHINKLGIGLLHNDLNKPISLVPNIMHAVDSAVELQIHINLFFKECYKEVFHENLNEV